MNTVKTDELLKGCSEKTIKALSNYKNNVNRAESLNEIVLGLIEKNLDLRQGNIVLQKGDDSLITDDLGLDSIMMMEIIMNIEEVLEITIPNEELMDIKSLGDLKLYISCKSNNLDIPRREVLEREDIRKLLPHDEPFLFIDRAELYGPLSRGTYTIREDEYFFKGHFKNEPVFPASIMIESLGQLAVLSLIRGNIGLNKTVDNRRVLLATCDGVRCTKLSKPKDTLHLQVKLERVKFPLAFFSGKITSSDGSKVISTKRISLAFDFLK
jgi:acyl carrier protein